MAARYVRADDPDGPEYYVRVLRPREGVEDWALVRDNSRNGGSVSVLRITREQWDRERLDDVFVPVSPERRS